MTTAPQFETHSGSRATLRAVGLVLLWAALTAGFLTQVWNGPSQREAELHACNPQVERCA